MAASMSWARSASRRIQTGILRKWFLKVERNYASQSRNILRLHERGLFQNVFPEESSAELLSLLKKSHQCVYCGFDPTADSLHIGNLLAIMALLQCQRSGHEVIAVIGGATAQIGDPSGRTTERTAMEMETVERNIASIQKSLHRIFNNHRRHLWKESNELKPVRVLDNRVWYSEWNAVDFLSQVGRYFRMGTMLSRHSVQSRLQSPEGMSLTEFTYQVFQAYDWLYLNRKYNCNIQIGGNDQLGNMMSGQDLISRTINKQVFGLTVPLVTTLTGDKLGKTAGNAVWLNPEKTSPFELYQFYIRLPDSEVEKYLKLFTFLPQAEIDQLVNQHKKNPEQRRAQTKVAEEVTLLVHGEEGLASAQRCTRALYGGTPDALVQLNEEELLDLFKSASTTSLILDPGTTVIDVCMKANCFSRLVDAERIIRAGGVYINHSRVTQPEYVLLPNEHILPNGLTLIRVGKKNYYVIQWMGHKPV